MYQIVIFLWICFLPCLLAAESEQAREDARRYEQRQEDIRREQQQYDRRQYELRQEAIQSQENLNR